MSDRLCSISGCNNKHVAKEYCGTHYTRWNRHKDPNVTKRRVGEDHYEWKGDKVGRHALHRWVDRHFGRESKCEECGTTGAKVYHWCSIGHTYTRNREDWKRMCPKCHERYDGLYRRKPMKGRSSKYKGVMKRGGRWTARICRNYKIENIGWYKTEEEAALAYNDKVKEMGQENAYLNIIPPTT